MFLLDTDVLSALRRRERNPGVVRWVENQRTADLHISVVTVGEIERGITRQGRVNPSFARELALWLDRVLSLHGDRVLAWIRQRHDAGGSFLLPWAMTARTCSSRLLRLSTASLWLQGMSGTLSRQVSLC